MRSVEDAKLASVCKNILLHKDRHLRFELATYDIEIDQVNLDIDNTIEIIVYKLALAYLKDKGLSNRRLENIYNSFCENLKFEHHKKVVRGWMLFMKLLTRINDILSKYKLHSPPIETHRVLRGQSVKFTIDSLLLTGEDSTVDVLLMGPPSHTIKRSGVAFEPRVQLLDEFIQEAEMCIGDIIYIPFSLKGGLQNNILGHITPLVRNTFLKNTGREVINYEFCSYCEFSNSCSSREKI